LRRRLFSSRNHPRVFYLILVSIVWAFSFGLIKNQLAGLDSTAVAVVRIAFSLLIFAPLLKLRALNLRQITQLFLTGAVQFGLMYVLYLKSYHYLQAFEVALFTITTPLYIALGDAIIERRWEMKHWLAALVSVGAALVIVWRKAPTDNFWHGLAILQISNLCFAAGQLAYRRIRKPMTGAKDHQIFGWLYLGALVATGVSSFFTTNWTAFHPTTSQWGVLAYLGILASGLCFFWWNRGALLVNAGTLASMNNAKIPLGVLMSLLFFNEAHTLTLNESGPRLVVGVALLCVAIWLAENKRFFSR
jgi:drug/metabolite transporter (DMT)-like permease